MIAKVVFPLPIQGPFDYRIPRSLEGAVVKGTRVRVPFRKLQKIGYVVELGSKSARKDLKSITSLLDRQPIIDGELFRLARFISDNYFCSLGEALEIILPNLLKRGRKIKELLEASAFCPTKTDKGLKIKNKTEVVLLYDQAGQRWSVFEEKIKEMQDAGRGIIVLSPEITLALRAKARIEQKFKKEVSLLHSKISARQELEEWLKVKNGKVNIVVGVSFAVFAPLKNLGLIIIDGEESTVYKQERAPYYNARDIALYRAKQKQATLILASSAPSIESYYLAKKGKYKLITIGGKKPEADVQIVDIRDEYYRRRRKIILSAILENNINKALINKQKVLLFLNRVGFSTLALCSGCGFIIKCERCNKNLIFIFSKRQLVCRWCSFKMSLPSACPKCRLSYIKYLGLGTERLESETSRLFPQAKILRYDKLKGDVDLDKEKFDIIIATQIILKDLDKLKDIALLGVISLDLSLNRIDFRAAEKTYQLISPLICSTRKKVIVQTHLSGHYIIKPLIDNNYTLFYREELRQRKELSFPPYAYLAMLNLRGKRQDKVRESSEQLFHYLKKRLGHRKIELFNPASSIPLKLRGNFRYNILLKSKSRKTLVNFLHKNISGFKRAGIIVTADIDPL